MLVEFHTHLSEWVQLPMGVATLNRGLYGNDLNYFVLPEDYSSGVIIILQSFYPKEKRKKKNERRMDGRKEGRMEGWKEEREGENIRLFQLIKVEI